MTATIIPAKYGKDLECKKVEGITFDEYTHMKEDAQNAEGVITAGAYFY